VSTDPAAASRWEWSERFGSQAAACDELGSPFYGRLLRLLAGDVASGGPTWEVVSRRTELRFGQAGPLRLLGTAHRLALAGRSARWAEVLPDCGGAVPDDDRELLATWHHVVREHGPELVEGLDREVQTNEVGRAAGLALAAAVTRFREARVVELGCSGGLNLGLDHFEIDLGGIVLGDASAAVHLRPEIAGHLGGLRHAGLAVPRVTERVGIDPHPVDPATEDGRLTLLSYVWPDQPERLQRVAAAIDVAAAAPPEYLVARPEGAGDTADVLETVLGRGGPSIVWHSIVWQYIPTGVRWRITEVMERAGEAATAAEPLGWARYEPDEWDRRRAAVWLRTWPHGGDRLVAHVDYHGRWMAPA
jgi:hypothetical protein